jgi:NAD(P)H-dependent FMN reductase
MLKHALDSNYAEYVHKPAGVVGVSSGVFGGARMIENLLPVLRTVGLAIIPFDLYVAKAGADFQPDERLEGRLGIFLDELIWMARTLRHGREHIPLRP